jgi:hypothetical protein
MNVTGLVKSPISRCEPSFLELSLLFFWSAVGWSYGCGAALIAASEVKRSGTRALSGFMRAERDTLRRGEADGRWFGSFCEGADRVWG